MDESMTTVKVRESMARRVNRLARATGETVQTTVDRLLLAGIEPEEDRFRRALDAIAEAEKAQQERQGA